MLMSQRNESTSIQDFLEWHQADKTWCYGTRWIGRQEKTRYLPQSTIEAYLKGDRVVEKLLKELYPTTIAPDAQTIREHYLRTFTILLSLGHGNFISLFTKYQHLRDNKLPFQAKPPNFPYTDGRDLWKDFEEKQWIHSPAILNYNMNEDFPSYHVLPVEVQGDAIGKGATSSVYKVIVHPGYDHLSPQAIFDGDASTRSPNTYVIKTYRGREAEEYYLAETNAYKALQNNNTPPRNIVCWHGSFKQNDTYNLILEYADGGNLEDLMAEGYPPDTGEGILAFWKQMFDLFYGVGRIHHVKKDIMVPGPNVMLGYHRDIKPANILVRRRDNAKLYDYIFLVADLGVSHFEWVLHPDQEPSARYIEGTYIYGAPETFQRDDFENIDMDVHQTADLWSLGCIFSEIALWIQGGWPRVLDYRQSREQDAAKAISKNYGELFHDGKKALQIVKDFHLRVMKSRRNDDFVTKSVLQGLVSDMLKTNPSERLEVKRLHGQTDNIIRIAEENLKGEGPQVQQEPRSSSNSAGVDVTDTQPNATSPISAITQDNAQYATKPGAPMTPKDPSIKNEEDRPPQLALSEALSIKRSNNKKRSGKPQFFDDKQLANLKNMDHVFLVDNSASMKIHRTEMEGVLEVLGYMVKGLDPDGIDLFFTMDEKPMRGCKKSSELLKFMRKVSYGGRCNMALSLGRILQEYARRLDGERIGHRSIADMLKPADPHRRRNIYVLTNGLWQPSCNVCPDIIQMLEKLKEHGLLQKHQMGIQFIRFGNDLEGTKRLRALDDDPNEIFEIDIVDTTASKGNVWKMLLGATEQWFDNDVDEDDPTGQQGQTSGIASPTMAYAVGAIQPH